MSFLVRRGQQRRRAGADLAKLAGLRLAQANEVESGSRLSLQTLKVAVSTEAISARALYANPITFLPTAKLIIRGNHKPRVDDTDGALAGACTWSPSTWWTHGGGPAARSPKGAVERGGCRGLRPAPGVRQRLRVPARVGPGRVLAQRPAAPVRGGPSDGRGRPRGLLHFRPGAGGGVLPWSKNALTRALEAASSDAGADARLQRAVGCVTSTPA